MKQKVLFVFAHPDDESFACGGVMSKYCDFGHQVSLVCATSGCKGRSGPFTFADRAQLAKHREQELRSALTVMGDVRLHLLRYADGALIEQDNAELAAKVKRVILEMRPDIVVTFPPNGVTGHPDHIAISKATEQAVIEAEKVLSEASGRQVPSLYWASIPHYYDHCGACPPDGAAPITDKINIEAYRERKGKALQAHQSQIYSVERAYPGVMDGCYDVIVRHEYFTLVRCAGQEVVPSGLQRSAIVEFL